MDNLPIGVSQNIRHVKENTVGTSKQCTYDYAWIYDTPNQFVFIDNAEC